jgi:hypothetical protein
MENGSGNTPISSTIRRLQEEDAVGQLRRGEGLMEALGSENGDLKLDWVEGVARLLDDGTKLEEVEAEAQDIWQRGIRHIIWAGMGGSVLTVEVMAKLGFCGSHGGEHVAIYPLNSTDPAALNAIVQTIATSKQLAPPTPERASQRDYLHALLNDVMMVGVSMGMTSEEPITHLTWFSELLEQAQLSAAEHILVMTLLGSYLDQFARERHAPSRSLQLDGGTGTGGRMSAPTTRVFLLPAALYLTRTTKMVGQLRATLGLAWRDYNLELATTNPEEHPFIELAAAMYSASVDGACRVLVEMPGKWPALVAWIEQLMEESLGKGNKGIVAFKETPEHSQAACFRANGTLHVQVSAVSEQRKNIFTLYQPYLHVEQVADPQQRLAGLATSFLGWQLAMALYGYLHKITFSGQPAVEDYKARARALRPMSDPLDAVRDWSATYSAGPLTLLAPNGTPKSEQESPAQVFAHTLREQSKQLGYLDLTINGEVPTDLEKLLFTHLHTLGNTRLNVPVKPRHAPADYHSTEQSEMDGPPQLISLRILCKEHAAPLVGTYDDKFLRAQAVSTWQAMVAQDRTCFLLLVDGTAEQATPALEQFFADVEQQLASQK